MEIIIWLVGLFIVWKIIRFVFSFYKASQAMGEISSHQDDVKNALKKFCLQFMSFESYRSIVSSPSFPVLFTNVQEDFSKELRISESEHLPIAAAIIVVYNRYIEDKNHGISTTLSEALDKTCLEGRSNIRHKYNELSF